MYTYNVWHLQYEAKQIYGLPTSKEKKRAYLSLFLSLCDSDEFIFFVVRYMHIDEMFSCYARRLSKHDAKTLPELLEEVFPHK